MSLHARLRAHRVVLAVALCIALGIVTALLAVFVVVRDERRAGRVLSTILSERIGHPVRITRVNIDGLSSLIATGIRMPRTGTWNADLSIREIRLEGPLLRLFVRPGGQHLRVLVVSTSLSLASAAAPVALPAASTLDRIRQLATRLLEWPATAAFALSGGELRVQDEITRFDVVGEKSADGRIGLRLTARSEAGSSMALEGVGSVTDELLVIRLTAEGDPRAVPGVWPAGFPTVKSLSGAMTMRFPGPSLLDLAGQVTLSPAAAQPPLSLSASASYGPGDGRLALSELVARWGPSVALEGSGQVSRLPASPRLELSLHGSVEGSPLRASLDLDAGARTAKSVVRANEVRFRRWLSRLGLAARLPKDLDGQAAAVQLTTEGSWASDARLRSLRLEAEIERAVLARGQLRVTASGVRLLAKAVPQGEEDLVAESSILAREVDARFNGKVHRLEAVGEARFHLPRSAPWQGLGVPDRVQFTLSDAEGTPILKVGAESLEERPRSPLDWTLRVSLPDLGRLPQLIPAYRYVLAGSASLDGRLGGSPDGSVRVQGELALQIPRATLPQLDVGLTGLTASVPIWHGIEGTVPWGAISMQSLTAYGVTFANFLGQAQIQNRFFNLPEATYAHYGGTGTGWIQADFTEPSLPIRARFEGSSVSLDRLVADFGLQAAKISGQARYVVGLIHTRSFGLEVGGQFHVDPPGGMISIDVLRDLLSGAPEGPLGIVRGTLEGLSEFRYQSLTGEISMDQQDARLSMSLQGRKRFGIFPPKIQAITIENVPLSRVARILGGQMRRDR